MTYVPTTRVPVMPMVSFYLTSQNFGLRANAGTPASVGWGSANNAQYVPLWVPGTCVVRRLWWANGSTVSASYNVDCGIYSDAGYKPGTRLVSTGSTAQGTATQVQFVDVTDTALRPGLYWVALVASSTSATFFRAGTSMATSSDAALYFEEASALPLPASATPVEANAAGLYVTLCGFATTASP